MARRPIFRGRELGPHELTCIRAEIESLDMIEHIDDDLRALIEDQWPDLVAKLPPKAPR